MQNLKIEEGWGGESRHHRGTGMQSFSRVWKADVEKYHTNVGRTGARDRNYDFRNGASYMRNW